MKWTNRYKHLVNEASEGIMLITKDGSIIDANHYVEKICECRLRDLKKRNFYDLVEYDADANANCISNLKAGDSCLFEASLIRNDTAKINVEISAKRFDDGGIATFIRDVSERKKISEALKQHAYLLENLKEAVIITDEEYRITMWNKGAEALYGWQESEVLGLKPLDVLKTDLKKFTSKAVNAALQKHSRWVGEVIQTTKGGEKKFVFSTVELIRNERGEMNGSISLNIDITEKINYEKKIQQHYEKLQHIAWIQSHQVRAPLSNILGIVKLIDYTNQTQENKILLDYLRASAEQMDKMIREITTLSTFQQTDAYQPGRRMYKE